MGDTKKELKGANVKARKAGKMPDGRVLHARMSPGEKLMAKAHKLHAFVLTRKINQLIGHKNASMPSKAGTD